MTSRLDAINAMLLDGGYDDAPHREPPPEVNGRADAKRTASVRPTSRPG
mgnify:CR=1 FL=1